MDAKEFLTTIWFKKPEKFYEKEFCSAMEQYAKYKVDEYKNSGGTKIDKCKHEYELIDEKYNSNSHNDNINIYQCIYCNHKNWKFLK